MCVRCSFNCPENAISIGFLDNWKVNGSYKLKQLEHNDDIRGNFISSDTKGVAKKVYKEYVDRSQALLKEETRKENALMVINNPKEEDGNTIDNQKQ